MEGPCERISIASQVTKTLGVGPGRILLRNVRPRGKCYRAQGESAVLVRVAKALEDGAIPRAGGNRNVNERPGSGERNAINGSEQRNLICARVQLDFVVRDTWQPPLTSTVP